MASYYTTRKQDVIDAVRDRRKIEWYVLEEGGDLWRLHVQFWIGADDIVYTPRAFTAFSETEARMKAEAQFLRLTTGRYISRPVLSPEFRAARRRLEEKIERLLQEKKEGEVLIQSLKIDWNAKRFLIRPTGRGDPSQIIQKYEPEYSAFIKIFKAEVE